MKEKINLILVFMVYVLVGSMETNCMSIKTGLIWIGIVGLVALLINRKKSATSRPRNGQVHHRHTKIIHKNCTPNKGGVSSVL